MCLEFKDLVGKTFTKVEHLAYGAGPGQSDSIVFTVSDDESYAMYYLQDCCASCSVEDICGDLADLVGSPIVRAEENSNEEVEPDADPDAESETWTFFRIGTNKGTVVIRWYGSSNGYYSETPLFAKI